MPVASTCALAATSRVRRATCSRTSPRSIRARSQLRTAIPPGVQKSDWHGFFGGIEYNQKIANNVELAVSVDGYSKTLDTSYRDYVNADDRPIQQTLQLSVVPIGLSVRLVPTSRRARIAPFVVVGVDAMVYEYEEFGDFIDFFDPERPIVTDSFVSDGVAFGFHAGGGLRVAVSDDFAIVGEGRYFWSKTDMDDDFAQNRDRPRRLGSHRGCPHPLLTQLLSRRFRRACYDRLRPIGALGALVRRT